MFEVDRDTTIRFLRTCIDGVADQVHHRAMDGFPVKHQRGKVFGAIPIEFDIGFVCANSTKIDNIAEDIAHVDFAALWFSIFADGEHVQD